MNQTYIVDTKTGTTTTTGGYTFYTAPCITELRQPDEVLISRLNEIEATLEKQERQIEALQHIIDILREGVERILPPNHQSKLRG